METKKLTKEQQAEYAEFFLSVVKYMNSGGEVSADMVIEMRNKIASILKSDIFTKGEQDELADMCILLHQSLDGE